MSRQRVTAWKSELQSIHHRLERHLKRVDRELGRARTAPAGLAADLLAHCYGFCAALTEHHTREDDGLFVRLLTEHPDLKPTIDQLIADHRVLATLITEFEQLLASGTATHALRIRLNHLHVQMSTHFGREEATLNAALDKLVTTPEEAYELIGDGRPPTKQ